jgi:hypothetical protein
VLPTSNFGIKAALFMEIDIKKIHQTGVKKSYKWRKKESFCEKPFGLPLEYKVATKIPKRKHHKRTRLIDWNSRFFKPSHIMLQLLKPKSISSKPAVKIKQPISFLDHQICY